MANFLRTVNFPYVDIYEVPQILPAGVDVQFYSQPYVYSKIGPYILTRVDTGDNLPANLRSILDDIIGGEVLDILAVFVNSRYDANGNATIMALFVVYTSTDNERMAAFFEP